jgi:hypothetical protein
MIYRIAVTVSAAFSLQQFYKNTQVWTPGTMVYPTIVNLIVALILVIWNGIVLCGYCFGKAVEERWVTHEGLVTVISGTLSAISAGIMGGTASNPSSVEGQTCGPAATQPAGVNCTAICALQVHYMAYEDGNRDRCLSPRRWLFRFGWGS